MQKKNLKIVTVLLFSLSAIAFIFVQAFLINRQDSLSPTDADASQCNHLSGRFRMITNKSYVAYNSTYTLFFEEQINQSGDWIQRPYTGAVDFMIQVYNEQTGQWSTSFYNNLRDSSGNIAGATCQDGSCTLRVGSNKLISRMYALRDGEASDYRAQECYEANSNRSMVEVNVGSTMFLKKITDYWPLSGSWQGEGVNSPLGKEFISEIGAVDENQFGGRQSWISADTAWYFLKNDMSGYHTPNMPWKGFGAACYNYIEKNSPYNYCKPPNCTDSNCTASSPTVNTNATVGNAVWYLKTNATIPGSTNKNNERFIVANGGYIYYFGACSETFNNTTEPFISNPGTECLTQTWNDTAYYLKPSFLHVNFNGTEQEPYYSAPSTNISGMRNYIIAPEWIGRGWGVYVEFQYRGGNSVWAVYSKLSEDKSDLMLSFREGSLTYLRCTNCDTIEGHREDWHFTRDGSVPKMVKIASRSCGPRALPETAILTSRSYTSVPLKEKRELCSKDKDIRYNDEIVNPHIVVEYN